MQVGIGVLVLANLLVLMWTSFQATGSPKQLQQPDTGNLRLLTGYVGGVAQVTNLSQAPEVQTPTTGQQIKKATTLLQPDPAATSTSPSRQAVKQTEKPLQLAENTLNEQELAQQWATQAREILSDIDQKPAKTKPANQEKPAEPTPAAAGDIKLPPDEAPKPKVVDTSKPQSEPVSNATPEPLTPPPSASEPPAKPMASAPVTVASPKSVEPATTQQMVCWRIGSFADQSAARKAAQQRPANTRLQRIRHEIATRHLGYIVIVPAQNGLAGAQKTVQQLRRKKVQDFQIMKSGPFIHAVSLGVFKARPNAESWVQTMHKKGLQQVVMRERLDKKNKYWLELTSQAKIINLAMLQSVYPNLAVQNFDCP